jgi:hypothetical protein
MNNLPSRKLKVSLSLVATLSLSAASGFGQSAAQPKVETQVLEKYVVTGSYLTQAANSIAIPVITIDTKSIENSGSVTNVLEILRKTTPQFSGNGNLGSSNANVGSGSTNGGSQILLRNAATLVLLNGRRSAVNPVSSTGGYSFVDVNMIPVAAIQRIEVLADGASAIYGTDAVSGVVNIILKTNYEGFEMGGRYGCLRRRWCQQWQNQHDPLGRVREAGPDLQLRAPLLRSDLRHPDLRGLREHRWFVLLFGSHQECPGDDCGRSGSRGARGQRHLQGTAHPG